MAIQNLSIKYNVNLPNTSHKILAKVGSNFYQIVINTFINGPNTYKIMPKLKNLAKSGHTAHATTIKFKSSSYSLLDMLIDNA